MGAGSVVIMEPGVYQPGHGGVRTEDTLVVPSRPPAASQGTSRKAGQTRNC